METPNKKEYVNSIKESTKYKIYHASILADVCYSLYYDLHTELIEQGAFLNKNLTKNYKRLPNLIKQIRDTLQRLTVTRETEDKDVDTRLSISQIEESLIRKFLNILMSSFTTELENVVKINDFLNQLPSSNVIDIEEPDWETLIDTLKVEPEKTN